MKAKALLFAALATACGTLAYSSQASAHDPLAGAIIGGGIGAAVGGPPGAAVGAVLGTIIGAEGHGHRHDRYYEEPVYGEPRHAPRRYAPPGSTSSVPGIASSPANASMSASRRRTRTTCRPGAA